MQEIEEKEGYDSQQIIMEQVRIQFEKEQLAMKKVKPVKTSNLGQIKDPVELCDLFESYPDLELLEVHKFIRNF